jgi:putative oxidoreductase
MMFAVYRPLSLGKPQSFVFTLLRFIAGFVFFFHGAQKLLGWFGKPVSGFGLPMVAGYIEFFGGLLIMLGLFTSVAAFIASGEMAFAYWTVHFHRGHLPIQNGGELAVMLCFVFLFLFTVGGGPLSLDRVFFSKRALRAQAANEESRATVYAGER